MLIFWNRSLFLVLRGFDLNVRLQQGHHNPSQLINNSHKEQFFCPISYLPIVGSLGLILLYFLQIPLQDISQF